MEENEKKEEKKHRGINHPSEKRLFTIPEAAQYLAHGPDAIREMIYGRELQIIQKGERAKIFLDRIDLDSWIETNKRFSGETK